MCLINEIWRIVKWKKCNTCNQTFDSDGNFWPHCGAYPVEEINDTENTTNIVCPKCNTIIEESNVSFCPNCGTNLGVQKANVQASVKEVVNKVKENKFVKSVKQDVGNSQSILLKIKLSLLQIKLKQLIQTKDKSYCYCCCSCDCCFDYSNAYSPMWWMR